MINPRSGEAAMVARLPIIVIVLAFQFLWNTAAFPYGAVSWGQSNGQIVFSLAYDQSTRQEAISLANRNCTSQLSPPINSQCAAFALFTNECVSVYGTLPREHLFAANNRSQSEARADAEAMCDDAKFGA